MKKLFTEDEIVLCAYIARFGSGAVFSEKSITRLEDRSESSIKMKISNIAAMLDEEGYEYDADISPLSGKTTGEEGRRTNWDVVSDLALLSKEDLKARCRAIFQK